MEVKVVAVEREDSGCNTVYGTSGTMLDNKYIIITANIIASLINDDFEKYVQTMTSGNFYPPRHLNQNTKFKIFSKNQTSNNSRRYHIEDAYVLAVFVSKDTKSVLTQTLEDWSIDTSDNNNNKELSTIMSIFFILSTSRMGKIDNFKKIMRRWWDLTKSEEVKQMDEIFVRSVAFGNKIFLDAYNRGIVSNIVGQNSGLIVSDCALTPGSEGSPVYKTNCRADVPVGIVIATACWWKNDWTGLTLVLDIRSIFYEFFKNDYGVLLKFTHYRLLGNVETNLLQVYCGSKWGTAIVINIEEGLLLTNSHVIESGYQIKLFWRGHSTTAKTIYKTPNDEVFDLALLQCSPTILRSNGCTSITPSKNSPVVGEEIFSAGFAIFPQKIKANPMITRGNIIQCNDSVVRTTCCINPGMSGGPVLNRRGEIIAVIVCNTRVNEHVYPRFNMAIPYSKIEVIIDEFLLNKDYGVLNKLWTDDPKITACWKAVIAKL